MKTHALEAGQFIHFICIPVVHLISFCISFLSRVDELNKLACLHSAWVLIAQLVEHCSAMAEATGSNPVKTARNFFSGYFAIQLKLRFNCDEMCDRRAHTARPPYNSFQTSQFLNYYISPSLKQISTKPQIFAKLSMVNLRMNPVFHFP